MINSPKSQDGFTLVELALAVVVSSIFLLGIFQLGTTVLEYTTQGSQQIIADNVAYKNMRAYVTGTTAPDWYKCTEEGVGPYTIPISNDAIDGLPGPITQEIIASAPYGCDPITDIGGLPIKVVSTVTYGPNNEKVSHATYATY